MSFDAIFKVCIFGDAGCGKTALAKRYMTNRFVSDTHMTIGVSLETKKLKIDKKNIKLQIWDFGGEERFRFFLGGYIKGSHGGIMMYDITNSASLSHVDDWLSVIRETNQDFPIVLTGGKEDLEEDRQVSIEEGNDFSKSRKLSTFLETSSKSGHNVENLFETLTTLMLETYNTSWR